MLPTSPVGLQSKSTIYICKYAIFSAFVVVSFSCSLVVVVVALCCRFFLVIFSRSGLSSSTGSVYDFGLPVFVWTMSTCKRYLGRQLTPGVQAKRRSHHQCELEVGFPACLLETRWRSVERNAKRSTETSIERNAKRSTKFTSPR